MQTEHPNVRSFDQLVADGILKANPEEPDYFEQTDDSQEIVYVKEGEVVDNFSCYGDEGSIDFCSPCGLEHLNEYDAQTTDKIFAVFQVQKIAV